MTTMQLWMLIGVPALLAGLTLFAGSSKRLGAVGVVVLVVAAAAMAGVDRASGAVMAGLATLLYATGLAGGGAAAGRDPVR